MPTTTDRVTEQMRARIESGSWRPGERLDTFSNLAREFDASTGTIRMAVQRLLGHGLVIKETRGFRVREK